MTSPPLHHAVNRNDMREVKRIIDGDDVDIKFQRRTGASMLSELNQYWKQETPLHVACRRGYFDIASYLIAAGSDFDGRTGLSPLHLAARNGYLDIVDLLIQCGADVNRQAVNGATPLWEASNMGHHRIVLRLIEVGANVNLPARVEDRRLTPLMTASNEGHIYVIELLIGADCKLDVQDSFGRTALHYASDMGFSDVVFSLLTVGANANLADRNGYYPLHAAASIKNIDTIKVLVENGHDVHAGLRTYVGTALHLAVTLQFVTSVEALIEAGLDLDDQDSSKYTPLYLASQTYPLDIEVLFDVIYQLIQGGSDINYRLPITGTLLEASLQKKHWAFSTWLLVAGCYVPIQISRQLHHYPEHISQLIEERLLQPRSLRSACRTSIRDHIRTHRLWPLKATVNQLPLPAVIKAYLRLEDLVKAF